MALTGLTFDAAADRDLEARVGNFLHRQQREPLTTLRIEARNGDVLLRGHVASHHDKHLAIHCCRRVAGVIRVDVAVDVLEA